MISSPKNRRVVSAARLKKRGLRDQQGLFLVEGAQAVAEALGAGVVQTVFHVPGSGGRVPSVVADAEAAEAEVIAVSDAVMAHLTSTVTPQGIVAVSRFVDVPLEDLPPEPGLIPVLCAVRDPGNAGTILRSADAAGASAVVFTADSVDVHNSKTVRASAGSLFHMPVVRGVTAEDAVAHLRARGMRVVAADAGADHSVYDSDLTAPTAVLLGNEAWGLRPEVRALSDRSVRVPIAGRAESLNLAAAAGLILFEAARQRATGGFAPDLAAVVSAAAHDLRLPLTAVKGFASTLAERWGAFDDAARREMVEGLALDVERTEALVSMVVDVARLRTGRFRPEPRETDLADAASSVAGLFRRGADYPPVEVHGRATAIVDGERFRAVLLALADGVLWYGREGPVDIRISSQRGSAVVEVGRSGGGPTPEELDSMFAGPAAPGARIGLYLAHRLAEAHGWSIRARGEDGITFVLTLGGAP